MFRRVIPLLVALAVFPALRAADNSSLTEYQIKAAFLYNFGKFVEWPTNAFQNEASPLILGILGDDPFGPDLERTIAGKKVNDRAIVMKRFKDGTPSEFCHILLISRSERRRLPQIISGLKGLPTLTVGDEIDGFCQQGGIINLTLEGKKVRFQMNGLSAQRMGLKISSKLQRLATDQDPGTKTK